MANIQQQAPLGILNNPAIASNADYVRQVLETQRRARLADALTQQGMQPVQYDPRGRVSWTQGLAKMLEAGLGAYTSRDAIAQQAQQQADANQRMLSMYMPQPAPQQPQASPAQASPAQGALAAGAQAGDVGPTAGNAGRMAQMLAPQQPAAPSNPPLNPFGAPPMLAMMASQGDPGAQEQLKTWLANQQATNEQKNWRDPVGGQLTLGNLRTQNMTELQKLQLARSQVPDGSPQAQQLDAAIGKANYVAPAEVKQGNVALDRNNLPIFYNPKTADGITPTFQTSNGVTMPTGARALPGYAGANAGIAGAEQGAKQANTIFTVPGPDNTPVTNWGGRVAGTQGANQMQQGDMQKRWADLYGQASQAQAVINNLQQIKGFAHKARTGGQSDRTQILDSVLSMMGSNDAAQRQIANNLLGKNAAQITARLSQGNLSTDAARDLLASAYPNAHMMGDAIAEAADNLIAQQRMSQAKAQALQGSYVGSNPQAYQRAEMMFDQAADPRLFQWKSMPPGPARDAYRQQIMQQDPSLGAKAQALQQMGVQ